VPGVAGAEVDLAQGRATVEGSAPADALVAAVAAAGYGVRVA
jgi:copper chaperone CopZ